jgi:hypothetical protein
LPQGAAAPTGSVSAAAIAAAVAAFSIFGVVSIFVPAIVAVQG